MAPLSSTSKPWLDYVYLVYFAMQPPIILLIDCVPLLYPAHLYQPSSAPLHFLQRLRSFYASRFGDQFFAAADNPAPWFAMFSYMELLFHLPVALWVVVGFGRRSGKKKKGNLGGGGGGGKFELVLLCYGLQTAVTTATCIYEVMGWNETPGAEMGMVTTAEQKRVLIWRLYGPYFLLPTIMFIDMFVRLSRRIDAAEDVKKRQ